ncbi:hypothetical protein AHF37_00916 [Paragonimus kellicotti]|nr:hypothetical protein AHF37_00916 [Paragonimus kellicotti]
MDIWRELYVPEDITAALSKANFTDPTPIQSRVLPSAIRDCADILGAAPTGSGKTLAYGVPLLIRVRDLQLAERKGTDAAYSTEAAESTDQTVIPDLPEKPSGPIDTSFGKSRKRKKLSESDLSRNVYTNLALVEELDEKTGTVRCVHSLLGDQYTEALDSSVSFKAGATDSSPSSCRSHCHRVFGLVLLPTRELALQVCQHLRLLSEFMEPRPRIEAIVGGISIQKQNRLLSYHPEILVATPGRLWHFIQQEEPHVLTVRNANILVVDEADKLIEANHFEELRQLFTWLNEFLVDNQPAKDAVASPQPFSRSVMKRRQTLVFSATLTFVHHGAMKPGVGAKHRKRSVSGRDTMTKSLKLADPNGILLASDVAARGLDLATTMDSADPARSGVAWVVHFEVPHTAELYIHRSGRTARAHRTGNSVLFICPNEMPLWRRLAFSLKRTDFDLPDLPVEPTHFQLVACEQIVQLAKQLDLAEHSVKRRAANEVWFTRAARDADIELDSDLEPNKDDRFRFFSLVASLRQLLGLNPRAKVYDLSTVAQPNGVVDTSCVSAPLTPAGLQEMRLLCPDQPSKDVRLFWFLAFRRHLPATGQPTAVSNQRSLIFVNSKTGVRRLAGVLRQLVMANAFSVSGKHFGAQRINLLHADMIQKQRLRALERFQYVQFMAATATKARGGNNGDSKLSSIIEDLHQLCQLMSQPAVFDDDPCPFSSVEGNLKAEKQIERGHIRRQFNKLRSNLIQLVTECQKSLKNKLSNTPNTPVHATSKTIRSQLKRISKNSKKRSIIFPVHD